MEERTLAKNISTPLAILISGVVIALAVIYVGKNETPAIEGELPTEALSADVRAVTESDHVFGSRSADVMLIEYSDLECPFCKQIHETLRAIVEDSNGAVAWAYRHFPLTSIHPKAVKEAEAAECAANQGGNDAFWAYVDHVYAVTPSNNGLDLGQLPAIAQKLGLDRAAFERCLSSGTYTGKVEQEFNEAIALGAQGTPFVVVMDKSGEKTSFSGALPRSYIERIIAEVGKR